MSWLEALLALVMLAGLVGVIVPVFPGLILVIGAALIWAVDRGGAGAWAVAGLMAIIGTAGIVTSTVLPARRATAGDAPAWVVAAGCVGLVVGFFAIPVIGALIGFPAGVLVAELLRHGRLRPAWQATIEALRGVGLGIVIQLAAGVVMIGVWAIAVIVT
jgi:hypothetical protein